jgi:hypothetical protein
LNLFDADHYKTPDKDTNSTDQTNQAPQIDLSQYSIGKEQEQ